ncbi:MAG: heavy metal-associated domain-containing protein [Candidatus ainarchaeum sp.]|nr:heavy metal-associated domain-containing protein [Candidatus ainarchaeum sp.]
MTERVLSVKGMHCRSCEMLLTDAVSQVEGVEGVVADCRRGTVTISCGAGAIDAVAERVARAIRREGYRV